MKMIEATMIFPITCLILIALISLIMHFYKGLEKQTAEHDVDRIGIYETREVTKVRLYDVITQ